MEIRVLKSGKCSIEEKDQDNVMVDCKMVMVDSLDTYTPATQSNGGTMHF